MNRSRRTSRSRDPRVLTVADLPLPSSLHAGHPAISVLEDHRREVGARDAARKGRVRKSQAGPDTRILIFLRRLEAEGIPTPNQEYVFHPKRKWRFDLAWPEKKLALEVEGGVFGKTNKKCSECGQPPPGAHRSVAGILRDIEKGNEAIIHGWAVLRILPKHLNRAETFDMIRKMLGLEAPA